MTKKIALPDASQRELIKKALDRNLLVEASAGSGKTTSMVDRMAALIAEGKCSIEKIAAVTFTRKAAAELQGRFQLKLEELFESETEPERRERLADSLHHFERGFVGTIHSFCGRLLRERPVEAGLDPQFEEMDELENGLMRKKCWEEYLERVRLEEGDNSISKLEELGIEPEELLPAYEFVTNYFDVNIIRNEKERPDFARTRASVADYLKDTKEVALFDEPEKGWDELQKSIRRAHRLARILKWLDDDAALIKLLTVMSATPKVTQNRWRSKEEALFEQKHREEFCNNVAQPAIGLWHEYCHFYVMELVCPAAEYFRITRLKKRRLNYEDLLVLARGLLERDPYVRRYFQQRYPFILIDEFQDTDPIQAEVMFYLTGSDANEPDWRKLVPRPGSLFIVGDPKQSIYRFRRADIDTYNTVKKLIEKSGGQVVPLTANFRSVPGVCEWANSVFCGSFGEGSRYQAAYADLIPMRPHEKAMQKGAVRKITVGRQDRHANDKIVADDAEKIARYIKSALDGGLQLPVEPGSGKMRPARPSDFMVLVMRKRYIAAYARALEQLDIPYETSGGQSIKDSEDLGAVMKLMACLADPDNPVLLAAVLRGPLFGASDDDLYRFKTAGGAFSFLSPKVDDEDAIKAVVSSMATLRRWHGLVRTMPVSVALDMIIEDCGIIPFALSGELGAGRAGNILKLLEFVRGLSRNAELSFPELVERLDFIIESGSIEEMAISPGGADSVRVMNLHKAKGLEAPVVFLAAPVKKTAFEASYHVRRDIDKPEDFGVPGKEAAEGYVVVNIRKGEFQKELIARPDNWAEIEAEENKYSESEALRLSYVAATRARDLLVISTYPDKPEEKCWGDFFAHVKDMPELDIPAVMQTKAETKAAKSAKKITRDELVQAIDKKIASVKAGSYSETTPKKISGEGKQESSTSVETFIDGPKGPGWGDVVHQLLRHCVVSPDADLKLVAENLFIQKDLPLEHLDITLEKVTEITKSPFWKRALASERILCEVPFCAEAAPEDSSGPGECLLSGTIDLAFIENGEWVVVDYKTDYDEEKNLDAYKKQVSAYRRYLADITDTNVKESFLYFVRTKRQVQV